MSISREEEELELIVAASNWEEAKSKLADVDIDEKVKITRRNINGLFMVMAKTDRSLLTNAFYQRIKDHKDISILADSASWARNQEVLDEIYKVETELRKLLLHVLDLVEAFYDLFAKTQYAKKFAGNKAVTYPDHLDPLTSRLMLGEMIEVLDFDLSWSKKDLGASDLLVLLKDVSDLDELRTRLTERLKPKRPWTIISDVVLSQPVEWAELKPKLNELKDYRNKAAHFQIVTESEKEKVVKLARSVFSSLTRRKQASVKQREELGAATRVYAERLLDISRQTQQMIDSLRPAVQAAATIAESQSSAFAKALGAVNEASLAELAKNTAAIRNGHFEALAKSLAARSTMVVGERDSS